MKEISKKYGFITATAMIVGICIGSGIFFKSDNILIATGGSILWGIVLFVVSAISIVFGCLTFGELASQTDQVGGCSATRGIPGLQGRLRLRMVSDSGLLSIHHRGGQLVTASIPVFCLVCPEHWGFSF